jgi:hypothetical protein
MPNPILKSAVLLAFTTLSALAVAADPPARVGRVALTQGQVSIGADAGGGMSPAQVNWPVTSGNMLTTAPGSRTELRIGSTSIRLDGDSSLDVVELDDDSIRLRLHYGSASVRVLNADVLRGFELVTPQARVRLQQPGRVRIDAERVRDTSSVTVFDGVALVESGGSQLAVRAGKRADITDDDIRTASAMQDAFDSWSASRDRVEDNARSARYVTSEMTGYEDLDRYGSWRADSEYGPLWIPAVSSAWVPYRDGSWTWIEPWGWTWVDNAPWGYAPFHYGRWVYVNRRWAWAPGSRHERLVWAPALVGWVGGADWNITFRDRSRRPGYGWYPLSPYDRYVPSYRTSDEHLRWLNSHVRTDRHRGRDYRPQGLTVVPQDRFGPGGRVNVPRAPIATVPPTLVQNGVPSGSAPPAPPNRPQRGGMVDRDHDGRPDRFQAGRADRDRDHDGRPDRIEAGRIDRNGDGRPDRIDTARAERDGFVRQRPPQQLTVQQQQQQQQAPGLVPMPAPARPQPVVSPTPHMSPAPQPVVSPTPHVAPTPQPLTSGAPVFQPPAAPPGAQGWPRQERRDWDADRRDGRDGRDRRDGRDGRDEGEPRRDRRDEGERHERRPAPSAAPVTTVAPPAPVQHAAVAPAPQPAPQPVQQAAPQPMAEARFERPHRGDGERVREAPQRAAPPPAPAPAPAPAPVVHQAPPPPQASAPSRPTPAKADERRRGDERARQAER